MESNMGEGQQNFPFAQAPQGLMIKWNSPYGVWSFCINLGVNPTIIWEISVSASLVSTVSWWSSYYKMTIRLYAWDSGWEPHWQGASIDKGSSRLSFQPIQYLNCLLYCNMCKYKKHIVAFHLPRGSKLRWREDMEGGLPSVRAWSVWSERARGGHIT